MLRHIARTLSVIILWSANAFAQGGNTGFGEGETEGESLSSRLLNLEKKGEAFNLYINAAAAAQADDMDGSWSGAFRAKHLRIEMKGKIGDRFHYRLRHRLNAPNLAVDGGFLDGWPTPPPPARYPLYGFLSPRR